MEPYKTQTIKFADMKAVDPAWHQILLRGIGGKHDFVRSPDGSPGGIISITLHTDDFLSKQTGSSASQFLSALAAARLCPRSQPFGGPQLLSSHWASTTGKGRQRFSPLSSNLLTPISIANMYFIPIAIFNGSPTITVGYYIWKSLIPTVIGNVIGGGLFVGATYWYLYLTGEGSIDIDFNVGSLESAMEAGGPMGEKRQSQSIGGQTTAEERGMSNGKVIEGQEPPELPHSGGKMRSGISKELSADTYAKRKGTPDGKDGNANV